MIPLRKQALIRVHTGLQQPLIGFRRVNSVFQNAALAKVHLHGLDFLFQTRLFDIKLQINPLIRLNLNNQHISLRRLGRGLKLNNHFAFPAKQLFAGPNIKRHIPPAFVFNKNAHCRIGFRLRIEPNLLLRPIALVLPQNHRLINLRRHNGF